MCGGGSNVKIDTSSSVMETVCTGLGQVASIGFSQSVFIPGWVICLGPSYTTFGMPDFPRFAHFQNDSVWTPKNL